MDDSKLPIDKGRSAKGADHSSDSKETPHSPANDAGEIVFGGAYVAVDIAHWSKLPGWSPIEAACATCGYDPRHFRSASDSEREKASHAQQMVASRFDHFWRLQRLKHFDDLISPHDALAYLVDREQWFPPELLDAVSRTKPLGKSVTLGRNLGDIGKTIPAKKKVQGGAHYSTESGKTKVIQTLQGYLLAVAIDRLGHDPDKLKSPAPKRIQNSLTKIGLTGDEDSIRQHLQRAEEEHWEGWPDRT